MLRTIESFPDMFFYNYKGFISLSDTLTFISIFTSEVTTLFNDILNPFLLGTEIFYEDYGYLQLVVTLELLVLFVIVGYLFAFFL